MGGAGFRALERAGFEVAGFDENDVFLAALGALRCQRLLMEGFDEGNMYLRLWVLRDGFGMFRGFSV